MNHRFHHSIARPAARGAHPRRVNLLAPLCLATLAATVTAQRFDNWVPAPTLAGAATTNMATDPTSGAPTLIVFAGGGTDTVAWNGTNFVSLGLTNNPGVSQGEMLAPFVAAATAGLVHLDSAGNTSIWTGGPSWTSLGTLVPSPSARALSGVTTVPGPGGQAFLFGGSSPGLVNDLWSFDGAAWTNRTPTSGPQPTPRQGASLTSDGQGGLLLYSGGTSVGASTDLWAWNGSQWRFAGKGPAGRAFHASLLDISRSQLMLAGGLVAGGPANDAWTLPLPLSPTTLVSASNWTQITAVLPFSPSATGLVTGAIDSVRNEPVLADYLGIEVGNDRAASLLVRGQSPSVNCVVPNLQLIGTPVVEPRVAAVTNIVPIGGLTGVAGAPMFLFAEFVVPGIGLSTVTPIPGTSCLSFLSPAALNIATTFTGAGGQYGFGLVIPPNLSLVGTVIDAQALGLNTGAGPAIMASDAVRIVIGR